VAVTTAILATYRDPGGMVRRMLAGPRREDRALAMLMAAAGMAFVAQWPVMRRAAILDPSIPLEGRMSGALMATLFVLPLSAYLLAGASHALSRLAGGRGTFYGARLALFWALLAVSPLMLLQGLVAGLIGPGPALLATGIVVFGAFLWIWIAGLRAAEFG
jgi:hypothetical protein